MRGVRRVAPHAAKSTPPPSALRVSRRADELRVQPDAGDLEEDTTVHRAGIGAMHVTPRDDPRGVDRREWDPEPVRDVHVRTEGQDAKHDLAADQRAGGLLDPAVAARDDTRA